MLDAHEYLSEARECYRQATEREPSRTAWWHLLGLVELRLGDAAGLEHLARASELAGDKLDAPRLRLARALTEHGRLEEADHHLDRLLQVSPAHAAALVEKARIDLLRGDAARAIARLQPCLTNAFTARPALLLLSQAQQRLGNDDAAGRLARSAAALPRPFDWPDPFVRDVQSLRTGPTRLADHANGLVQQRRYADARAVIQRLRSEFPDDTEGLLLLGRLLYLEKSCSEAESTLRQYLAVESGSLGGRMQLALVLLCQERWRDAASLLEEVIRIKPDMVQAHYDLGIARERAGDLAAAAAAYQGALRCTPDELHALTALSGVLLRGGDVPGARVPWERARQLNPEDEGVRRLAPAFAVPPVPLK
jgi:tetratricopeptide (TPR) repeat protein